MRATRLYISEKLCANQSVSLSPESSHYLTTVLRMRVGDTFTLFCGDGYDYSATIITSHPKKTEIRVTDQQYIHHQSPIHIHLAQALCRGEKMDFVIQKATELGVSEITPIICDRTQGLRDTKKLSKKYHHWQKVMISACEQSGRAELPILNQAAKASDFFNQVHYGCKLMLHPDAQPKPLTRVIPLGETRFILAIGPEGGFSESEITQAENSDFSTTLLGPRTLRTETAALAIISALQLLAGDF